jgi:hypothetical protein
MPADKADSTWGTPNATYLRRHGLPSPMRNVPRLTQRKKLVVNKENSLYLTQKQQRKLGKKARDSQQKIVYNLKVFISV